MAAAPSTVLVLSPALHDPEALFKEAELYDALARLRLDQAVAASRDPEPVAKRDDTDWRNLHNATK